MRRWWRRATALAVATLVMIATLSLAAHLSQRVTPKKKRARKKGPPIQVVRQKKPRRRPTRARRRARATAPVKTVSLPTLSLPSSIQAPAAVSTELDTKTLHRVALKREQSLTAKANLIFTEEMVDDPPRVLIGGPPSYPFEAQQRGIEGEVKLRILVSAQGAVTQVHVVSAKPAGVFDEAAMRAARRYRFRPARYHGRAVQVWVVKTFMFRLR